MITNFLSISNEKGKFDYTSLSQICEWEPGFNLSSVEQMIPEMY